jgi:adenylate cyclase
MTGRDLADRTERRITWGLVLAHTLGVVDVFAMIVWVLPLPDVARASVWPNVVAIAIYMPLALLGGYVIGTRNGRKVLSWLYEDRPPTESERVKVLRQPLVCTLQDVGWWLGGLVLFAGINLAVSFDLAAHIACTVLLGALTVSAVSYLLVERIMRPVTALALRDGVPDRPVGPGVQRRLVLAWLCASGVPLVGLVMVGVHALSTGGVSTTRLAVNMLVLGGLALFVGLAATLVTAKSVSGPITSVRRALARVQAGDLGTAVRIDDGSEIGLLQSGFNSMAAGLREREHLRDLFGRHVGEDVARAAIAAEPALGGEQRDVAVLFVDLIGSTALAASRPPHEVVALLNRFFGVVVETVDAHGGWVNKFEGDAAMCVFGAPVAHEDPAACALAAARELHARLVRQLPEVDAGIGVSAGTAVAGWVGAERRLEYTVIGDPVNEASRLCDLAKRRPERVLACEAIVDRAQDGERSRWLLGEATQLRGRVAPTRLAIPAA